MLENVLVSVGPLTIACKPLQTHATHLLPRATSTLLWTREQVEWKQSSYEFGEKKKPTPQISKLD